MNSLYILLPLYIQALITFILLFRMGFSRIASVRSGQVKIKDIALGQSNWPDKVTLTDRSYHNQFEMPVLFYAIVVLAIATQHVDIAMVALAWVYMAFRILHTLEHNLRNHIVNRLRLFFCSSIVLLLMWLYFLYLFLK